MNPNQNIKRAILLSPQLKDNGDFADNGYIDTVNYGRASFLFITGTCDAAIGSTAEGTAPKIEECDTTDGTYTAVTDAALADAIAATEDDSLFLIDVDLKKSHKRYMRVNAPHSGDGTTGCYLAIIAELFEPIVGPASATERGLAEYISA